jgi:glycosyltransferase involved in cell wall biosynthesis
MRILHVTPHLPPDQAANALLPFHLGAWARAAGHDVGYAAHPPRAGEPAVQPGLVTWIPTRHAAGPILRTTRIASLLEAVRIVRQVGPALTGADVVHIHGNGLLAEVAARIAAIRRKPVVLTLYGTEIWHYRRKRIDLFTRMMRSANRITFYSRRLLERSREHGLGRPGTTVVYPPVADAFQRVDAATQAQMRQELRIDEEHLLVNVKRLHPLAAQHVLIAAMPAVLAAHSDTRLVICGTGPRRAELEQLSDALGLSRKVTFAGLVDNAVVARYCAAADLFVLPSALEACPTVAVEALASGTPVVSTDNPGGVELRELFGDDVDVVPRERSDRLAERLIDHLGQKRRTRPSTDEVLRREFRPAVVWSRFQRLYEDLARPGAGDRPSAEAST